MRHRQAEVGLIITNWEHVFVLFHRISAGVEFGHRQLCLRVLVLTPSPVTHLFKKEEKKKSLMPKVPPAPNPTCSLK